MEDCDQSSQGRLQEELRHRSEGRRSKRSAADSHQGERGRIAIKIQDLMNNFPVCPVSMICNSEEYLKDPELMYVRADHKIYMNIIDSWMHKICRWNIFDFKNFYTQGKCAPVFHSGYMNTEDVYLDYESSMVVVEQLLRFQFNDDNIAVKNFLIDLFNVLERKM